MVGVLLRLRLVIPLLRLMVLVCIVVVWLLLLLLLLPASRAVSLSVPSTPYPGGVIFIKEVARVDIDVVPEGLLEPETLMRVLVLTMVVVLVVGAPKSTRLVVVTIAKMLTASLRWLHESASIASAKSGLGGRHVVNLVLVHEAPLVPDLHAFEAGT